MYRNIIFSCLLLCLLAACHAGREGPSAGRTKIRLGLLEGPTRITMAQMIRQEENRDSFSIDYIVRHAPDLIIADMIKGELDFALLPITTAALLHNRGVRYRLMGVPLWGTLYLAGTDQEVQDLSDLRGKRVHVMGRGMTPDILLQMVLKANGLQPGRDVILDYSFPAPVELANAIQGGVVSLGIVSEPHLSMIMASNSSVRRVTDLTAAWNKHQPEDLRMVQTAFMVSEAFLNEYPGLVKVVEQKFAESVRFMRDSIHLAAGLLVDEGIFESIRTADSCLRHMHLDYRDARSCRDEIQAFLQVILVFNEQLLGGGLPNETFYYLQ